MKRSRVYLFVVLIFCIFVLSSCGGKEFAFDNTITWRSTFADILAKYGEPDETSDTKMFNSHKKENYDSKMINYTDFNCCGYDGCRLYIYTNESDKTIGSIFVYIYSYTDKQFDDVLKALIKKYGEPNETIDHYLDVDDLIAKVWNSPAKETIIEFVYKPNNVMQIQYFNTQYYKKVENTPKTNGI